MYKTKDAVCKFNIFTVFGCCVCLAKTYIMIVFFPLHKIMKYKKKRYDRSDHFYCCFRNRQFHVVEVEIYIFIWTTNFEVWVP